MNLHLWLRDEEKETERRTPLSPAHAKALIEQGVKLTVEESQRRVFPLKDYLQVGCESAPSHTWPKAPKDAFILGLKEIEPNKKIPFTHRHIYFAHSYKGQDNAEATLSSYRQGGGQLFDLEYLVDDKGRRIAAFGKWAGFVGTALAIDHYYFCQNQNSERYPELKPYPNQQALVSSIKEKKENCRQHPSIIIIGAHGRCGQGAQEAASLCSLNVTPWDREETAKGGPFLEINDHNIFVNCALMTIKVPPFLTQDTLSTKDKNLTHIADVGCDPTSNLNPIPIYNTCTNWQKPFLKLEQENVHLLSVDNLPSLLPLESSLDFSEQLFPHLVDLADGIKKGHLPTVWKNAHDTFQSFL